MTELPAAFGKYFLTEKIATGGMAEIYLAKLIGPGGFEKQLVIKQIHPELGGQRAFVEMFVAEAKTLVGLSHGNIVPIYELGVVDDTYFIAMEYIDGPTLERLQGALAARGRGMEPAVAAYIAAEILKGLDYAHRKGEGVIHRDLSPRNVMLSRDGEVKLVDFGIAVPLGQERDRGEGAAPVGSFPYMSPEQVRGARLTGQSDVFSAGVLLWELLAGRRLFARASAEDTLAAVTDAPVPPPSAHRGEVPAALDEICLRALARDPAARYASAAACLADVHRYLYSQEAPVAPVTLSRLVAACCPPEARHRGGALALATTQPHADSGDGAGAEAAEGTVPLPRPGKREVPEAAEGTVPLPRGKQARASTHDVSAQSFATHVEIERVLSGTAAPRPDAGAGAAESTAVRPAAGAARGAGAGAARAGDQALDEEIAGGEGADRAVVADPDGERARARAIHVDARARPPRRTGLGVAALALVAGLAGAMFLARSQGSDGTGEAADPAGPGLARAPAPAGQHGPRGPDPDAAGVSAPRAAPRARALQPSAPDPEPGPARGAGTRADAPAEPRARQASPRSPGRAPGRDARAPLQAAGRRADAGPRAVSRATGHADTPGAPGEPGTLKVGANPWGEVYVDGRKLGRAPNAWQVAAGAHVVEVVFPAGDPPPRQRFEVTVAPGQTVSLGVVDFSAAARGL